MDKIRKLVKDGNLILGYISGFGILAMSIILFYEIVVRSIFNAPTIWVQEVSVYLFMWTMLAGASYTLMLGKHVRIDLLYVKLSKTTQHVLDVITNIMGAVLCAFVSVQAWEMIASSFEYGKVSATILRVPLWIIQLSLLLGFILLTLQFVLLAIDACDALKHPETKETNA